MKYGWCRVGQLREAVKDLADDDLLIVNAVGNLAVGKAPDGETQLGYIELGAFDGTFIYGLTDGSGYQTEPRADLVLT